MGLSSRTPRKVAVLMGGPSVEREVSLSSGRECAAALRGEGYEVVEIDAGEDLCQKLTDCAPDVVFNALHGRYGEDGCVQGILEWMGLPYTHSGVLASASAMDKIRSKDIYVAAGLPIAPSRLARKAEVEASHVMPPPYVVKPYNEGSSVGVYIVHEGDAPPKLSAEMPAVVMVEAFAPGRELTCTVMGDRALCVTDIITDGWYDYDAKYSAGGSRHVCPAELSDEMTALCQEMALRAHTALGCRGVSRTDFRWDETKGKDGLILLETNTQPGMTPTSLSPEQAQAEGMTYGEFVAWMVEDASCDR
ncbi:D-alanine--D-alanine ligase [Pacificibacter maritimus]|uniref:D-alanine--D-alanine ligase n=1 Tax=Pacificibacter maritimus TaxID=762213 RepID=A0A3N4UWJ1_9RHOB|nr:D-alanine--D-alanine ligase [Pacificibacter maritimus]RPE71921.1 D-alanine--D-alanine ligase [Pacificibacter maritimus]